MSCPTSTPSVRKDCRGKERSEYTSEKRNVCQRKKSELHDGYHNGLYQYNCMVKNDQLGSSLNSKYYHRDVHMVKFFPLRKYPKICYRDLYFGRIGNYTLCLNLSTFTFTRTTIDMHSKNTPPRDSSASSRLDA